MPVSSGQANMPAHRQVGVLIQVVAGSSPAGGANKKQIANRRSAFCFLLCWVGGVATSSSDQREEQVQTLRSKFATSNARGVRVGHLVPLRASPRCGHRLQKRAPGTFLLR